MNAWSRAVGAMLGAVVLVVAACGDAEGNGVGDGDGLEGRTFLSQQVTDGGEDRPLVEGTIIRLAFSDGEVRAHAGCNHLFGTVESTAGGRLVVGPMGGTEMGCEAERHEQDRWLTELLTSTPTWSLDGDRLVLTSGTTVVSLLDRRVADPDRPLEGTRWLVDTILADDAAMSVPAGAQAELTLTDGQVVGFTGCNELTGAYRVEGDLVHLEPFAQTDRACEPEMEVLEEAVAVLSGEIVTYRIEAARLTLVAPDGRGLGLYAAD